VRIMLLCLDNLGDLVFSSSLLPPLMASLPAPLQSPVQKSLQKSVSKPSWAIFCKAYAEDIAHAFPANVDVIAADPPWDESPGGGRGSYVDFYRAVKRARNWRPDVILVASKNWRAAAAAYVIGGKTRIGFTGPKSRFFLTDGVSRDGWQTTAVTTMLARLLAPLGIDTDLSVAPPVLLQAPVEQSLSAKTPQQPYVMLHPFAGDLRRCWPLGQWSALANQIRNAGYSIIWMGRADEADKIKGAAPETAQDTFMWELGDNRLVSTLAVTARAAALVGHDSGPIHFAAALGVPVLGLYLPSEYPRTVTCGRAAHEVLWRKSPGDLSLEDVQKAFTRLLPTPGTL
jgi:ADP-heptose:LPS heptosyltransferase